MMMFLFTEVTVWLGISVAHTALIAWSLPSRSDLLIQLEYTGAISNIIVSLQYVCVQDLSEVCTSNITLGITPYSWPKQCQLTNCIDM